MTNNTQSKLNDTLCSKNTISNDFTTAPTINEKQKEDVQCHPKPTTQLHRLTPGELYQIDRRQFNKNYITLYCPHCGNMHPLSRYLYKKIKYKIMCEWSRSMHNQLTQRQRIKRASKAGTQRAINAGQKLRKPINVQEGVLID